jgi:hypothetical protein
VGRTGAGGNTNDLAAAHDFELLERLKFHQKVRINAKRTSGTMRP